MIKIKDNEISVKEIQRTISIYETLRCKEDKNDY